MNNLTLSEAPSGGIPKPLGIPLGVWALFVLIAIPIMGAAIGSTIVKRKDKKKGALVGGIVGAGASIVLMTGVVKSMSGI